MCSTSQPVGQNPALHNLNNVGPTETPIDAHWVVVRRSLGGLKLPADHQQLAVAFRAGDLHRLYVLQYDGIHSLHALHVDNVGVTTRET